DDLCPRHMARAERQDRADGEILEIALGHGIELSRVLRAKPITPRAGMINRGGKASNEAPDYSVEEQSEGERRAGESPPALAATARPVGARREAKEAEVDDGEDGKGPVAGR